MGKLKLCEFNLYGAFPLKHRETYGIEDLVQRVRPNTFLSRSADYYPNEGSVVLFAEICEEYARLNAMLPAQGKVGFVICEKMHELAVRVVNNILQETKRHLFQNGEHFDTVAQKCVQECADNLVRLFHQEPALKTTTPLSDETFYAPDALFTQPRITFMDNKKQLFMCANALPTDTEHLITPGRGSSKLGALVQSVRKRQGLKPLGFTQLYYSYYYNCQSGKVFAKPLPDLPEKVLVMDDIIVNGHTLRHIKKELTAQGHKVLSGAVTASFQGNIFYNKKPWRKSIDLIPNQYSPITSDQDDLRRVLKKAPRTLNQFLEHDPRNTDGANSADYIGMKKAEQIAKNEFNEDLYTPSANISPESASYNDKIREQVQAYNY